MSILYISDKANAVTDAISRFSMDTTTHVEEEKREIAEDVHRLACRGVRHMDSVKGGIVATNGAKLSPV